MMRGKLWTQRDRYGNDVYLTQERWEHITDPSNHPDLLPYLENVRETIRHGHRRQDSMVMNAYKYYHEFDDLPDGMNQVVVVVIFKEGTDSSGRTRSENFIVTAYFQFFERVS